VSIQSIHTLRKNIAHGHWGIMAMRNGQHPCWYRVCKTISIVMSACATVHPVYAYIRH